MTDYNAELLTDLQHFSVNLNYHLNVYFITGDHVFSSEYPQLIRCAIIESHLLNALQLLRFFSSEKNNSDIPVIANDYIQGWTGMLSADEAESMRDFKGAVNDVLLGGIPGRPPFLSNRDRVEFLQKLTFCLSPIIMRFLKLAPAETMKFIEVEQTYNNADSHKLTSWTMVRGIEADKRRKKIEK